MFVHFQGDTVCLPRDRMGGVRSSLPECTHFASKAGGNGFGPRLSNRPTGRRSPRPILKVSYSRPHATVLPETASYAAHNSSVCHKFHFALPEKSVRFLEYPIFGEDTYRE